MFEVGVCRWDPYSSYMIAPLGDVTFLATLSVPAIKARAFVRLVAHAAIHTGLVAHSYNEKEKKKETVSIMLSK